jgi:cytidyltransferase-like protein
MPTKECRKGAVGGTFSLMHRGHRHLLRVAAEKSKALLVGVSSDEYASARKAHPLEPYELRALSVLLYLLMVDPDLEVEIHPLDDAFGPAYLDGELECIFVSEETVPGAVAINILRRLRGLAPLRIYSVELITDEKGVRLSSTALWSRFLRNPAPNNLDQDSHTGDPPGKED